MVDRFPWFYRVFVSTIYLGFFLRPENSPNYFLSVVVVHVLGGNQLSAHYIILM